MLLVARIDRFTMLISDRHAGGHICKYERANMPKGCMRYKVVETFFWVLQTLLQTNEIA